MIVLLIVLLVLVLGVTIAALAGRMSLDTLDEPVRSSAWEMPSVPVASEDLAEVRFDLAVRGYNMQQVDELLEGLRSQLARAEKVAGNSVDSRESCADELKLEGLDR